MGTKETWQKWCRKQMVRDNHKWILLVAALMLMTVLPNPYWVGALAAVFLVVVWMLVADIHRHKKPPP